MSIILKDHVTDTPKTRNEDLFRCTDRQALLLDGSTNLGLYGNMPDAGWFVDEFSRAFLRQTPTDELSRDLAAAMDRVAQLCIRQTGTDPRTVTLTPSASMLLVREQAQTLELSALGDCSAVVYYRDGRPPRLFRDDRVDPFDGKALQAMQALAAQTGTDILSTVKTPQIRHILEENRSKMNTPQGYWILAFSREALKHIRQWTLPKDQVDRILMFTDGFDRMAEEFLHGRPEEPLQTLCRRLREQERADENCNLFPRFHTHDDACAALLEFQ